MPERQIYVAEVELCQGSHNTKQYKKLIKIGHTDEQDMLRVEGIIRDLRTAGYTNIRVPVILFLLKEDLSPTKKSIERQLLDYTKKYDYCLKKRFAGQKFREYRRLTCENMIRDYIISNYSDHIICANKILKCEPISISSSLSYSTSDYDSESEYIE